MPQPLPPTGTRRGRDRRRKPDSKLESQIERRYSVGLPSAIVPHVERYAETVGMSMSKAIATLVRLGLEGQENRKREFFKKLRENLANDDPKQQERVVDEFRALILGH